MVLYRYARELVGSYGKVTKLENGYVRVTINKHTKKIKEVHELHSWVMSNLLGCIVKEVELTGNLEVTSKGDNNLEISGVSLLLSSSSRCLYINAHKVNIDSLDRTINLVLHELEGIVTREQKELTMDEFLNIYLDMYNLVGCLCDISANNDFVLSFTPPHTFDKVDIYAGDSKELDNFTRGVLRYIIEDIYNNLCEVCEDSRYTEEFDIASFYDDKIIVYYDKDKQSVVVEKDGVTVFTSFITNADDVIDRVTDYVESAYIA